MNAHFCSIGKELASQFDETDPRLKDPLNYIQSEVNHSIYLQDTDLAEIILAIMKLNVRKACGYDSISNKILRASCYVIAAFLVDLFNKCLRQGVFPDIYKIAQVIPLFKGGEHEILGCYRPISLLPALGKLLETVVQRMLTCSGC